jgi:hypothetical protein
MPVESKHPSYTGHIRDWEACRDVYHGQSAVKARDGGKRYLPPTMGMILDGMRGREDVGAKNYATYLERAKLDGFFADAIDFFLGLLWHAPPVFDLQPTLEAVFGKGQPATSDGENLTQLLRRMHVEQMVTGRLGLLADMPAEESSTPTPYIELYPTESIINWDDGARQLARRSLNLVVIDESGYVLRPSLDWEMEKRYRVLVLGSPLENEEKAVYRFAVVKEGGALDPTALQKPALRGRPLEELPFVFCGTKGTTTCVDDPPFLALVNSVIAVYQQYADYRQSLHVQGQDTLVTIGAEKDEVVSVGAGAHINISNPKGDAKFIGISADGLGEVRQAIENERMQAAKKAGEMLADNSKQRESGEALVERGGKKGASILDIANTSAEALQRILRIVAKWMGAGEAEVNKITVTPNRKFGTPKLVVKDLLEMVQAYVLNAPITLQSIHEHNVAHGGSTLTWDELIAAKRSEVELLADLLPMPAPAPGEEDEDEEAAE